MIGICAKLGSWLNRRCDGGRFPSDGQSAFDAGASAFGRGDLEQAEAGFRAAMYEDPKDLSSISNLGMVVRTILSIVRLCENGLKNNVMIMSRGCIRKERPRHENVLALFPLLLGDDFGHYLSWRCVDVCAHGASTDPQARQGGRSRRDVSTACIQVHVVDCRKWRKLRIHHVQVCESLTLSLPQEEHLAWTIRCTLLADTHPQKPLAERMRSR